MRSGFSANSSPFRRVTRIIARSSGSVDGPREGMNGTLHVGSTTLRLESNGGPRPPPASAGGGGWRPGPPDGTGAGGGGPSGGLPPGARHELVSGGEEGGPSSALEVDQV